MKYSTAIVATACMSFIVIVIVTMAILASRYSKPISTQDEINQAMAEYARQEKRISILEQKVKELEQK